MKPFIGILIVLSLLLMGCGAAAIAPAPSPTPSLTATEAALTPILAAESAASATPTPEVPLPTDTTSPLPTEATSPTPRSTATSSHPTEISMTATPLVYTPTSSATAPAQGTFTKLADLPPAPPVDSFTMSPNAEWLAYITIPAEESGAQPVRYGPGQPTPQAAVLHHRHIASGKEWEVTQDCTTYRCEYVWLSTGELVWREQGNLYVANPNGEQRRDLAAPEAMIEILGQHPDDILIVRGTTTLWRLYLPDGTWDRIPDPVAGTAPPLEIGIRQDRLYLTSDGSAAYASYTLDTMESPYGTQDVILYIPFAPSAAPIMVMPPTTLHPATDEGNAPRPPVPLTNSPYWMPQICRGADSSQAYFCFWDTRTGSFVASDTVLAVEGYQFSSLYVSPDGKWLAAPIYKPVGYLAPGERTEILLYVAPSNDPAAGQILEVDGDIIGWQSEPAMLFVNDYLQEVSTLIRYDLNRGVATPLFDIPNGFGSWMTTSEAFAFIVWTSPGELLLNTYGLDGSQYTRDDPPDGFGAWLHARGNRLYYIYTEWMGESRSLWLYEVP